MHAATLSTRAATGPGARMCRVCTMPRRGYDERLRVPLRWWALATMFLASMLLAFLVATPLWVALRRHGGPGWPSVLALFVGYGAARVSVARRRADRRPGPDPGRRTSARSRRSTPTATRRLAGRDADARAYLLLRPYLRRAVRVARRRPGRPDAVLAGQHPSPGPAGRRARRRDAGRRG